MLLALLLAASSCHAATQSREDVLPLLEGGKLRAEEAQELEARVLQVPNDLDARARLLGYYQLRAFKSEPARKTRQGHVLWVIEHHPGSTLAGSGFVDLNPTFDGEVYYRAREMWIATVKQRSNDATVLHNASQFLFVSDKETAKALLLQGAQLEPECPDWPRTLGQLTSLSSRFDAATREEGAAQALAYYERALALTPPGDRGHLLSDLAKVAFEANELDKAETAATEVLADAANDPSNRGDELHQGNLILGRLALRKGDVESARAHLLAAGRTPGSPVLGSFGPNMTLALELLKKGEKAVVLEYLGLCASFWKHGKDQLAAWTATIKGGGIPDFGANLTY